MQEELSQLPLMVKNVQKSVNFDIVYLIVEYYFFYFFNTFYINFHNEKRKTILGFKKLNDGFYISITLKNKANPIRIKRETLEKSNTLKRNLSIII